jgi:hypothetical protein
LSLPRYHQLMSATTCTSKIDEPLVGTLSEGGDE